MRTIDKKTFLRFFILVTYYTFLTFFIFQAFFIFKKTLAKSQEFEIQWVCK